MANTFVTLKEIARQALPVLHQNLLFPNIIYTDYAQDFHGVGDTVKVRKPVIYEAGDFNEASGVQWQDIVEDSVEVTLDHIATVDARASAIETATCIDDLNRVFVEPAAIAIAEKINSDGLNLYKDVFRRVGTAGQTPSKLSDIAAARKALNLAQAPTTGRCAVWDVDADANFMSLDALVNAEKAGSNQALREGSIGRIYGMDNYMSQAVKKHETGITSAAGVKVNGAVAAGSTHVSIDGTKLEGYLKKGDLLTIGGGRIRGGEGYLGGRGQRHCRRGGISPHAPDGGRRGSDAGGQPRGEPGVPSHGLCLCHPAPFQPGRPGRGKLRHQLQRTFPAGDPGLRPAVQAQRVFHGRVVRIQDDLSGIGGAHSGLIGRRRTGVTTSSDLAGLGHLPQRGRHGDGVRTSSAAEAAPSPEGEGMGR